MMSNLISRRSTALTYLDDTDSRILSQPLRDNPLLHVSLKAPYILIFQALLHDVRQSFLSTIMATDPLMQFKIDATERCAILELSLIIDVCRTKTIDLDTAYDCNASLALWP